ncbi:DnaB-like helicase N-terminal domain-containing protein [Streptomyces sp. NPDC056291]|uniref:DnaB-like helicase N-terminal domain-containing protein n=1 Tax=Streptomyces sp. NPDC056291 TaxID=3345772 RepID=UPI0035D5B0B7
MPQWLRPKLPEGPLRVFNRELHALHGKAGYPSARKLYLAVGKVVSHTNIHHAFVKPSLPSWGVVEVVVEQLAHQARPRLVAEAEINRFKTLWDVAHASVSGTPPTAGRPTTQPASAHESSPDATRRPLLPSAFFNSRNSLIYQAIVDLHTAGGPVGVPQVAAELRRRGQLELCGGEDYLFECVKVAIKGAYEAGMGVTEFAVLNARKVQAAADAREELMASMFEPGSDANHVRRASNLATELYPRQGHQQTGKSPSS